MITLMKLPFAKNALEPYISEETLTFHHDKHHKAYVDKTNELLTAKQSKMSLEEIILHSEGELFNNAAQVWNHNFFWNCLSPKGGDCCGKVSSLINETWGDFDTFKEKFSESAKKNFGSGWTWLVLNKQDKLEIINTSNAENPIPQGLTALLTLDVWEHAYYIDYRNSRPEFIEAFWSVVNWDFVNSQLK